MARIDDWPVKVRVLEQEEAERLTHDAVPPPSRDQRLNWIRQLEAEELPFQEDAP